MHLVLAGEFLRRLNIWLDSQIDCGFLANKKEEIDEVTLMVKFSHDFHRKLRPLSDLKKWKDRELQNLFLHASLAVSAILPSLLQLSAWLVTDDVITDNDAEIAKLLIQSYQRLIPTLYGESEQTCIHLSCIVASS